MTKTLTEQWREGTLPEGWYYCRCYDEVKKLYCEDGESLELDDPETSAYYFFHIKDEKGQVEVLAPVLPYRVLYDKDQGIFPVLNIVLRNIEREQCRRKLTDLELSIKSQVKGVLAAYGLVNKTYESFGNTEQLERLQEQLKEANEVIDACCSLPETNWVVIDSYKEKWGVK